MRQTEAIVLVALLAGCGREALDAAALRDPAACAGCHPDHVEEWSGSMHAYASDDPIFQAMNRRGQRETGGALGDFCVRCHAPMAVRDGLTADGLDLASLPAAARGVTCVACHQLDAVEGLHNGALRWRDDGVMRGGLDSPVDTPAHGSRRSAELSRDDAASSRACGACHDVRVGDVMIERTYAEWADSLFARPEVNLGCVSCHMFGRDAVAAVGGPTRRVHGHDFPGVDVALIPFPQQEAQAAGVQRDLASAVWSNLCVVPGGAQLEVTVTLDNAMVGHAFPSGTTHARRLWVELTGWRSGLEVWSSGSLPPGEVVHAGDPEVWVLGSRFFDDATREVQFAWQVASIESELLSASVTADPTDPRFYHARSRTFLVTGEPDQLRLRLWLEPVGRDLLDELVTSGDLDPSVRDRMPRHELSGAALSWSREAGFGCVR